MPLQISEVSKKSISNPIFSTTPRRNGDGNYCSYLPTASQTQSNPSIFDFMCLQTAFPILSIGGTAGRLTGRRDAPTSGLMYIFPASLSAV